MKPYFFLIIVLWHSSNFAQSKTILDLAFEKGIDYYNKGQYEQAAIQFEKCVQLSKKEKNIKFVGKAYNNLGNVNSQIGKSEESLRYYLLSMDISKQLHDTLTIAKTSKNIGALYEEQKDFNTAMQYYEKALALAKSKQDKPLIADCYNNMGVVYEQQMQYSKALEMYSQSLSIYEAQQDSERISMALNNVAIVLKYLKKYPEATAKYQEALAMAQKSNDTFMVAATQNNLGNVYQLIGNYKKALALCQQASINAKAINAPEILIETYDGIALAYEKMNQFEQAILYRKKYETEKEKFINTNRSDQLIEMQTKYETKKKEDEILQLHQNEKIRDLVLSEQQLQIERRNGLLIANVLLLLGLLVLAYFWRSRQQLKETINKERIIKETEELERLRIAKDIHDDLGSGLSKINFLSELIYQKTATMPEVRNNSQSVKETAAKMIENMRDLIWALNPDNTTLANLISRMREYTTDYFEDYPIHLHYEIPEFIPQSAITKESHRELFMVVKETLNNISKYAKATEIVFSVALTPNELSISIRDNGVGFVIETTPKGNGLSNIKNRIDALGGNYTITSEVSKGTQVHVVVPIGKITKIM